MESAPSSSEGENILRRIGKDTPLYPLGKKGRKGLAEISRKKEQGDKAKGLSLAEGGGYKTNIKDLMIE